MNTKQGYIYIMTNKYNSVLYVGVTSNLPKRIWEHKNKVVEGFTKDYNLTKLVYYEVFDLVTTAIEREKYLKGKTRKYKQELIKKFNAEWNDLYEHIL